MLSNLLKLFRDYLAPADNYRAPKESPSTKSIKKEFTSDLYFRTQLKMGLANSSNIEVSGSRPIAED